MGEKKKYWSCTPYIYRNGDTMPTFQVLQEKPVTLTEMRALLGQIKKRDEELSFRGTKTEEYLNVFAEMEQKKVEELMQKIRDLNVPRLKEDHIVRIVDILPKNVEEMKILLQGYTLTVTKENMEKIVKVLKE